MGNLDSGQILDILGGIIKEVKEGFDRAVGHEDDIRELGMDSLDIVNYLFSIEERFNISLPMDDVEEKKLFVLGRMVNYLRDGQI